MNSKTALIITIIGISLTAIVVWPIGIPLSIWGLVNLYKLAKKGESREDKP